MLASAQDVHAEPARFRFVWIRGAQAEQCPDGAAIARTVNERLGREVFSNDATSSVEGFIEHDAKGFRAHVYVRDERGALQGTRDLASEAAECWPISAAVTLAIALTIDPDAALGQHPSPIVPVVAPPPPPPALPPPAPEPIAPTPPASRFNAPTSVASPHPVEAPGPLATGSSSAVTTAGAVLAGGLLPGAAPGLMLASDIGVYRALRGAISIVYLPEEKTTARAGAFGFGLTAASLGACLSPLSSSRGRLVLCGDALAGSLHAVVYSLVPLVPGEHPWAGAALTAKGGLYIVGPLSIEAGGQLVVPITRNAFAIEGVSGTVFQQPPVAAIGFLGLALSIR